MIKQLHHISIIIQDIAAACFFYEQVLGLKKALRPDLGFPGVFYELPHGQQLHLLCVNNPYTLKSGTPVGGRNRHIAFAVEDIAVISAQLDEYHIPYNKSRSGRRAIFCNDPDDNILEFLET